MNLLYTEDKENIALPFTYSGLLFRFDQDSNSQTHGCR